MKTFMHYSRLFTKTASGNHLGALLIVWYLAIWSSASTHANKINLILYHVRKNFCGIYNLRFCALRSRCTQPFYLSFAAM